MLVSHPPLFFLSLSFDCLRAYSTEISRQQCIVIAKVNILETILDSVSLCLLLSWLNKKLK